MADCTIELIFAVYENSKCADIIFSDFLYDKNRRKQEPETHEARHLCTYGAD